MAATTQSQPVLTALPPTSGRAGFRGTLASEFTKIRSVRSTYWTLLVLLVVSVGIGAAVTAGTAANWSHMAPSDRATFDPTQASVAGLFYLGQLVIVVFGAMTLTAEYSTGMIRTLVPGCGAVAAGRRGPGPVGHGRTAAAAPVLRLDPVRRVRHLHRGPARGRRGPVPQA